MQDNASPGPVYATASKSFHLMPEALLALFSVSWGVRQLHSYTKSRAKKKPSSLRIFSARIIRKLMEIMATALDFNLAMTRLVDINTIGTDTLGVVATVTLLFLGLVN